MQDNENQASVDKEIDEASEKFQAALNTLLWRTGGEPILVSPEQMQRNEERRARLNEQLRQYTEKTKKSIDESAAVVARFKAESDAIVSSAAASVTPQQRFAAAQSSLAPPPRFHI